MIFPIVLYGDPVLKKKASEIEEGDDSVKEFVASMYETMYAAQGVGLAAPQIGESLRVFVIDTTPMEDDEEEGLKEAF
ncbi:MAG: peptide deformylase, partial [Ekhidna sp.]|nr:peptide deformylase [Ekhidna sp.]